MSEAVTQTVVDEVKTPAVQGAETDNAQGKTDELDTLLKEFGSDTPGAPEKTQPEQKADTGDDEIQVARNEVFQARDEIRRERFNKDMDSTIEQVRGDLDATFFDKPFVKAWIDARATDDPRLQDAWLKREQNPQQFKRVVTALGKEFAKKYGKLPDKNATDDIEAVTAAVRGASTKVPEGKAPDFSRMTDSEFQAEKDKMMG